MDELYELYALAERLGLTVIEGRGPHLGGYRPGDRAVRLTPNQPERVTRSALAHEIGHHVLGHQPTPFGPIRARQENSANAWAARLLIARRNYIQVEQLRDGHVEAMAFDLAVLPELVLAYQWLLHRERSKAVR